MPSTTLSLSELRVAVDRLIESIAEQLGDDVDLGSSTYWLIETDEAFDLSKSPSVNAGSLVDDVEQVHRLGRYSREELQVSPWHDLDHLKGILSRLSMMTRG